MLLWIKARRCTIHVSVRPVWKISDCSHHGIFVHHVQHLRLNLTTFHPAVNLYQHRTLYPIIYIPFHSHQPQPWYLQQLYRMSYNISRHRLNAFIADRLKLYMVYRAYIFMKCAHALCMTTRPSYMARAPPSMPLAPSYMQWFSHSLP